MAKQPPQPRPAKPVPIPSNWGKMNPQEKAAWRQANNPGQVAGKPVGAPKQYPPKSAAAAGAEAPAEMNSVLPPGYELGDNQRPVNQEQAGQLVAQQIAAEMGEMDLRAFCATILRAVADALEGALAPHANGETPTT